MMETCSIGVNDSASIPYSAEQRADFCKSNRGNADGVGCTSETVTSWKSFISPQKTRAEAKNSVTNLPFTAIVTMRDTQNVSQVPMSKALSLRSRMRGKLARPVLKPSGGGDSFAQVNNLFDQAGMASLFPPTPPPELPKLDKRSLPPPIRQAIVDAHAEYPELSLHEIASICYVQFGRKPSPHTIQYILATGPQPSRTGRRYKRFAEIDNPVERRKTILKLHAEGWTAKNIAGYLETSRQTVHTTLKRWAEEQFAGIEDKSHARTGVRKVDLKAVQEVKKVSAS